MTAHGNMIGLFFYRDIGDYYQTGEIIRQVHENAYLTRLDDVSDECSASRSTLFLFTVEGDFSAINHDGNSIFRFFDTRADLQAWLTWLNTPTETPKEIVRPVKRQNVQ